MAQLKPPFNLHVTLHTFWQLIILHVLFFLKSLSCYLSLLSPSVSLTGILLVWDLVRHSQMRHNKYLVS